MSETTEKRKSSAELKKEIEAAQTAAREQKTKTELLQSGLPMAAIADRINGNSTTEIPKAESKSQPAQAPAEPATEKAGVESPELKEWAKKKGINWDTPDSVLLELRKKDQEFHKKQAEKKRETVERPPVAPAWTPPPVYNPPPTMNPYPTLNPRSMVENLARQYNALPEDFERVAQISRDMVAAMLAQDRQRQQQEIEDMKRENIKNSEFRELSADPVFRKPEVGEEFHRVLEQMQETEPESFSQDPYAYRKAFDRALMNIGRRNLESSVQHMETNSFTLPKNPPKPLGNGSGGGREANEGVLSQSEFDRLPSADKRKYLESLGLVQPKY